MKKCRGGGVRNAEDIFAKTMFLKNKQNSGNMQILEYFQDHTI